MTLNDDASEPDAEQRGSWLSLPSAAASASTALRRARSAMNVSELKPRATTSSCA